MRPIDYELIILTRKTNKNMEVEQKHNKGQMEQIG